ncbi:hypothetical protein [Pseudomonas sp. G2-4]|uniref:hypothetical protein n=1 Tax=Pseudomonas sp. G2-4 TaxID=1506334 RepID=UPI0024B9C92C|nr:hypothetical protein [Pseudomonas sp. G2-4]WHS62495.1 hypothetical protein QNH97_10820 [Pseudomonas sp. G2-4]
MMSLHSNPQQWHIDAFCRKNGTILNFRCFVKIDANMLAFWLAEEGKSYEEGIPDEARKVALKSGVFPIHTRDLRCAAQL